VLLLHVRAAWNDYFPVVSLNSLYSQTFTSRQTPSNTGVYILNCLFKSIESSDAGGALSCSSSAQYLLVESTSFFSCKTSSNAGALYFYNTNNGQCVLYNVCGNDCCTTNSNAYQFVYIVVYNSISNKNYFNYSSISSCVNVNAYHTLRLCYGKILCPSVNSSLNKYRGQSFYCIPTSDSNSVTGSLTYSSFADNIATDTICVLLSRGGVNYEIKSCNILRNTQGSLGSHGTIYTSGNLMIADSCIIENKANYNFYLDSSSYTITLSNCTVDSISYNRNLVTQNTVAKSFILALNHMSTLNCHSEYDYVGTLTPIIQSPTSSKKQKLCYTCEKFLFQFRLSDVISLISILVFNFIHQHASSYHWY
jgi:hypothetical protein